MKNVIPNSLKTYRKRINYTQKEVVKRIGLASSNRLSEWEQGISAPNIENLLKLCALYKTVPEKLYPEIFQQIKKDIKEEEKKYKKEKQLPITTVNKLELPSKQDGKTDDELLEELADILVDIFLEEENFL